jgi:hypothetical protein
LSDFHLVRFPSCPTSILSDLHLVQVPPCLTVQTTCSAAFLSTPSWRTSFWPSPSYPIGRTNYCQTFT